MSSNLKEALPNRSALHLETERLLVRNWRREDVPFYMAMSTDIGYNCFAPPGIFLVKDEEEALLKIEERIQIFDEHGLGKFPIFEKSTGNFIGTCGASFFDLDGKREVEIGYRLMLKSWGKGYATEAAKAVLDYLRNDLGVPVYGLALPVNSSSVKILEKLELVYLREFNWKDLPHSLYVSKA